MGLRAFSTIDELEDYCETLNNSELAEIISEGSQEYGYKINPAECAYSKYELELMSEILRNRS
jgi:hypothetical protein